VSDEYPDYEYLDTFGPEHHDGFYQVPFWLHRPCGAVVADRDAHNRWHAELSRHVLKAIREEERRRGVPTPEQRAAQLKVQLRRDLLAQLRAELRGEMWR
jgi:hypothetical protein